jgi:hypothetical protein
MASVVDQTPTSAEATSDLLSPKGESPQSPTVDYSSIKSKVSAFIFY